MTLLFAQQGDHTAQLVQITNNQTPHQLWELVIRDNPAAEMRVGKFHGRSQAYRAMLQWLDLPASQRLNPPEEWL